SFVISIFAIFLGNSDLAVKIIQCLPFSGVFEPVLYNTSDTFIPQYSFTSFLGLLFENIAVVVAQCSDTAPIREPLTVPYMIPFFGRTVDSTINIQKFFHGLNDQTVYGAKIFGYKVFFIQGPEMILALWKIKTKKQSQRQFIKYES
ncbi:uncharacterized protein Bfra_010087, partial [Botrytis fragariae]